MTINMVIGKNVNRVLLSNETLSIWDSICNDVGVDCVIWTGDEGGLLGKKGMICISRYSGEQYLCH